MATKKKATGKVAKPVKAKKLKAPKKTKTRDAGPGSNPGGGPPPPPPGGGG